MAVAAAAASPTRGPKARRPTSATAGTRRRRAAPGRLHGAETAERGRGADEVGVQRGVEEQRGRERVEGERRGGDGLQAEVEPRPLVAARARRRLEGDERQPHDEAGEEHERDPPAPSRVRGLRGPAAPSSRARGPRREPCRRPDRSPGGGGPYRGLLGHSAAQGEPLRVVGSDGGQVRQLRRDRSSSRTAPRPRRATACSGAWRCAGCGPRLRAGPDRSSACSRPRPSPSGRGPGAPGGG